MFPLFVRLQTESGYSQAEKKTILEKLSEWLLEIIDKIRELVEGGDLNDVVRSFAKQELDRFSDIRGMFLEVLDKVEGVEGAEGVKSSNKRLTNGKGKRYNKNSTYDEFRTNGMQWAYNSETKIGDTGYGYNPRKGKYCILEATKTGEGFIVVKELTSAQWRNEYESIRENEGSLREYIGEFASERRSGNNSGVSRDQGTERGDVRLSSKERLQSDKAGNLERDGQDNKEVQKSIKRSVKGLDFDYLSAVENGDTESAQKMVDEALGGYIIEVMNIDQAREYLEQRLKAGNYSLYAKLGESLVIDGKGALWKDIRNWTSAIEVKPADVTVVKKVIFMSLSIKIQMR